MNRKILCLALILLALLGAIPSEAREKPLIIWLCTDTHHLSPELTDYGPMFQNVVRVNDGKLTEHSGELIDGFFQKARQAQADCIVITGDLTFDGERASLEDFAEKCREAVQAGIPVLVVPGNHDISSKKARNYFLNKSRPVDGVSQEEFLELCSFLGYDQALARDESSFSYIYEADSSLWLLFLDCNTDLAPIGTLPEGTIAWLEEWLKKAQEEGKTVLSFSHQNLLPVNELYYDDFTIHNGKDVLKLYERYGVRYSFSGHSHIQHETTIGSLTEYVTGPLCVTPLHYGVITAGAGEVSYEAFTMDMYQEEAKERFRSPMLEGMKALAETYGVTQEEGFVMADYAATLNQAYFAGDKETVEAMRGAKGWQLWKEHALGSFWYTYMWSIFEAF